MNDVLNQITLKIKATPNKPGVYIFRDKKNKVIYVGKAKSLKKRVASYFNRNIEDRKVKKIQYLVKDFEFIATDTETEALILENSLIKLHKPIFNIRLIDDKTYPYILITTNEKYPRVEVVRKRKKNNGLYFGPFTDKKALTTALRQALKIFPIASCKKEIIKEKFDRPCLYYQLKKCTAPCVKKISMEEYKINVQNFIKLFEGKYGELQSRLQKEMDAEAKKLNYEKAAIIRDKIDAIRKIMQKQSIYSKDQSAEYDILGIAKSDKKAIIQFFAMREGRIIEQKDFLLNLPFEEENNSNILNSFIKMYYSSSDYTPQKIIIGIQLEDQELLSNWLTQRNNKQKISILTELEEEQQNLLDLANKNAKLKLESHLLKEKLKSQKIDNALKEIKEHISLKKIPERIEGYDISTMQGTNTVGSCVVFYNGLPEKKFYRRFKIKSIDQQDDYASIKEVLERRFTGSLSKKDPKPDLILIDGGLGQANIASKVLKQNKIQIPVIGLAKEFELIFFPEKNDPIKLDERSEGLKLLQRIRDEAHRFAVSYHRKKRSNNMLQSSLEKVPNIGKKRMEILLEHFSTIEAIKSAKMKDLIEVPGISKKIAQQIIDYYNENMLN